MTARQSRRVAKMSLTELRSIARQQLISLDMLMKAEKEDTDHFKNLKNEFVQVKALIAYKERLKKSKQKYR